MKWWLVGILAVSLIWPWPALALDLQGLYQQALNASRSGDFVPVSYTHLTLPTKA